MLYPNTLQEISTNINTGIEYEIALFYKLLTSSEEQEKVLEAINKRGDKAKVLNIIPSTDIGQITNVLQHNGLELCDVTFETQNDNVGPSDIVLLVCNTSNTMDKIGISIKYDNSCTRNCSHHYFISTSDKEYIKAQLPEYISRHIKKMDEKFGEVSKWFRNRECVYSDISNEYIDLIRDRVIYNWEGKTSKEKMYVLSTLLQMISPIEYWVYTYNKNNTVTLDTTPFRIHPSDVDRVVLTKNAGQFIQFSIDSQVFAQMQVKFNNGILERYKSKKKSPDIEHNGIKMKYGDPFGSWNFSVKK